MHWSLRTLGAAIGLILAIGLGGVALAQEPNTTSPTTVTVVVEPAPNGAPTTITVQLSSEGGGSVHDVRVAADAPVTRPAVVAARAGTSSIATVPVDATRPFDWHPAAQPAAGRAGCGPVPSPGTPGCEPSAASTPAATPTRAEALDPARAGDRSAAPAEAAPAPAEVAPPPLDDGPAASRQPAIDRTTAAGGRPAKLPNGGALDGDGATGPALAVVGLALVACGGTVRLLGARRRGGRNEVGPRGGGQATAAPGRDESTTIVPRHGGRAASLPRLGCRAARLPRLGSRAARSTHGLASPTPGLRHRLASPGSRPGLASPGLVRGPGLGAAGRGAATGGRVEAAGPTGGDGHGARTPRARLPDRGNLARPAPRRLIRAPDGSACGPPATLARDQGRPGREVVA
jgi:hypothetical protein